MPSSQVMEGASPGSGHRDHNIISSLAVILRHLHGTESWKFNNHGGIIEPYFELKSALLTNGYGAAFTQVIIAIVLNHIRTIFLPWLGVDMWPNPMEQLRLARSNPEVFLDEFHSITWTWIVLSTAQRLCCQLIASWALDVLSTRGESHLSVVGYLVWIFTTVEYLFSRFVNTSALVVAVWRLSSGESKGDQIALTRVVRDHWPKMLLTAGQLTVFTLFTVVPIATDSAQCMSHGHLGLPLFLGFLGATIRAIITNRSFFFIALEMSGMFIAAGWLIIGGWTLLGWFADDSAGMKWTEGAKKGLSGTSILGGLKNIKEG